MANKRIAVADARRTLFAAQGLSAPGGGLTDVLERTGFVRTLGGTEAYIAIRARSPGIRAAEVNAAIEKGDVLVLPAVRGCMYLLARRDADLALRLADTLSAPRAAKERTQAGITEEEVAALGKQVVQTLRRGPLTTDALRRALPEGSVRSLGEKGKKLGISSTLPGTLRILELARKIERVSEGARLDTERYVWRSATRPPAKLAAAQVLPRIAEIYLRGAGLGTLKELATWAGVSQRDCAQAVAALETVVVDVDGFGERIALASTPLEHTGVEPAPPALLPFEDNLLALQGTAALLIDPAHHRRKVPTWGASGEFEIGGARHISQRTVVAEGKIVGFWDYDPDAKAVVTGCFDKVSPAERKQIAAVADSLGRFLTEEIGHGRSFSLDTDDELRHRVKWVRGIRA